MASGVLRDIAGEQMGVLQAPPAAFRPKRGVGVGAARGAGEVGVWVSGIFLRGILIMWSFGRCPTEILSGFSE